MRCQFGFGSRLVGLCKGKWWLIFSGSRWLRAGQLDRHTAPFPLAYSRQDPETEQQTRAETGVTFEPDVLIGLTVEM